MQMWVAHPMRLSKNVVHTISSSNVAVQPYAPSKDAISRILDISRALAVTTDLDDILRLVVDAGRAVLGAEHGAILLYEGQTDEFVARVPSSGADLRFPPGVGIAGACARRRGPVNIADCASDPWLDPNIDWQTGFPTRCLLAVPMIGLGDEFVGVLEMLNKVDGSFDAEDELVLEVLAAQAAVAFQRARLLGERERSRRMERDFLQAAETCRALFPSELPLISGYELAGCSRPASETSGDVYDVIARPDGSVVLVIADAVGHGVGPALSVTGLRAMVRMGIRLGVSLDTLVAEADHQLCTDLKDTGGFVTGFVGRLDPRTHLLSYHAAGQGPLLHEHAASGLSEWRSASALPFGVQAQVFKPPMPMYLERGDVVVLATDGVYECVNSDGDLFGTTRVAEALAEVSGQPATQIAAHLMFRLDEFAAGTPFADDVTILLLVRTD